MPGCAGMPEPWPFSRDPGAAYFAPGQPQPCRLLAHLRLCHAGCRLLPVVFFGGARHSGVDLRYSHAVSDHEDDVFRLLDFFLGESWAKGEKQSKSKN